MTLYQLECFIQVAELLSFVQAAEKMYISQPAITYQIRSLEKEMDVLLFERSTRHCKLTPAGQSFYHDAVQLLSFTQLAVKKTQDIHCTNELHLRVGIRKLFDYDSMTHLVEQFYSNHPNSRIDILPQMDGNPLDDLRSGRIDTGFFYSCEHHECLDIDFEPLYEVNYYVLMKPDNPLSARKELSFQDLKNIPIATAGANTDFLSDIQRPIIINLIKSQADLSLVASSFESALIMVRSGKAMLILPMLASTEIPGMVKVALADSPTVTMEIGWMKQDSRKNIIDLIKIACKLYRKS